MKNGTHDNENEPLTFTQLGLQTALIINRIRNAQTLLELAKDQEKQSDRETARGGTEKENAERHREAVDSRLKDLAAFERRVGGKKD
jgi:hypothetical protein